MWRAWRRWWRIYWPGACKRRGSGPARRRGRHHMDDYSIGSDGLYVTFGVFGSGRLPDGRRPGALERGKALSRRDSFPRPGTRGASAAAQGGSGSAGAHALPTARLSHSAIAARTKALAPAAGGIPWRTLAGARCHDGPETGLRRSCAGTREALLPPQRPCAARKKVCISVRKRAKVCMYGDGDDKISKKHFRNFAENGYIMSKCVSNR